MAKAESYTHVRVLVTAVTSVALPYLQNMSVTQKPTSVEELFPWPSKDATDTKHILSHAGVESFSLSPLCLAWISVA